jgi:ribose transport system ATP-binding protein
MNQPTKQSPIEVDAPKKSFGAQRVLRGIDFQVAQAETLAVLGRSGTGKSERKTIPSGASLATETDVCRSR